MEKLNKLVRKVLQDIDFNKNPVNESVVESVVNTIKDKSIKNITYEELYCALYYDVWVGEKYRHYNGNVYTVIHLANLKETDDYKTTVVYQGDNGLVWTRPIKDWNRSFTNLEDYGQK